MEIEFIICSADNRQPDWLMKCNYFCLISFSASLNMQKEIKHTILAFFEGYKQR